MLVSNSMERASLESEHEDSSESNSLGADIDTQIQHGLTQEPEADPDGKPTEDAEENAQQCSDHYQLARRRELNRLSKARCRKRRNDLIKTLEAEMSHLTSEHNSLKAENAQLRQEYLECFGDRGQVNANHSNPIGLVQPFQNTLGSTNPFASFFLQGTSSVAFTAVGTPLDVLFTNQGSVVGDQQAGTLSANPNVLSDQQRDTDLPPDTNRPRGL